MLVKISLIVALCAHPNFNEVQKRMTELQSQNPKAAVSVRIDKKAICSNGMVLTGKDAKLMSELTTR